jgi:hypothetical protein
MIHIENEKLSIEINHGSPKDFVADLKEAIIATIQYQNVESGEPQHLHFVTTTLLELMKALD